MLCAPLFLGINFNEWETKFNKADAAESTFLANVKRDTLGPSLGVRTWYRHKVYGCVAHGLSGDDPSTVAKVASRQPPQEMQIPDHVDWSGLFSLAVLDQFNASDCNASWPAVAADVLSGLYNLSISREYLTTCTHRLQCDQSGVENALKQLEAGVCDDAAYAEAGCSCSNKRFKLHYQSLADKYMMHAVSLRPVLAAVSVSDALQFYKSGVIDTPFCDGPATHDVIIVGYGKQDGVPYWNVRNTGAPIGAGTNILG